MCDNADDRSLVLKQKLEQLYLRKCSQLERAKTTTNIVMLEIYKAEAAMLRVELDKF